MAVYVLRSARQCGLHTEGVLGRTSSGLGPSHRRPIDRSAACHWPHGTACGRMCPQDPFGPRTVSPQPVSSTRRRLSTDEMQLREVGKLAVHPWKMQWLQRPGPRAPLGPVRPQRSDLSVGTPPGRSAGPCLRCPHCVSSLVAASPAGESRSGPRARVRGPSRGLRSGSCGTVAVQGNLTV